MLFWTTDTPPEIKNYAVNPKKIGTITIILDGQQRLTTLILLKNEWGAPLKVDSKLGNKQKWVQDEKKENLHEGL